MARELRAGRIDKREPDPRAALKSQVEAGRDSYAALSRMLGRPGPYLSRYVREGLPVALTPNEHRLLADHFGLDERGLGIRDLWVEADH